MEALKDYSSEIVIGSSMDSFQKTMESQKQLFHSQIDQLRSVVITQCKLTGINPLSQEMAAGALSINIGKRPRDQLNLKALKYMQAVFSIKDAISKKESREIGALFGLTVTQVREYFASQRSWVRKMVRLSREKAIRAGTDKELQDGVTADSDLMLPINPTPLTTVGPSDAEEASSSNQDEVLPGLGESERKFVENIFSSMCKEETFSGQVKLMEWILQMENPSVLCWFLTKGGVMILATWLSQAANEEQTSVISAALKVLCHLPLNKALPAHMSAILQGVNKLRFYRIPDISNRARVLLSKWSKMFAKSQALKKPNGTRAAGDIDLTQRIGELVGDDLWPSSVNDPDSALVPSCVDPNNTRKGESVEAMKLLTAPSDESNKKLMLGTSAAHNKERRKVQLVEQPGHKTNSKIHIVKAVPTDKRRPITADEIQKAKLRAQFLQSNKTKTDGPKRPSLLTSDFLSASEAYLRPKLEAQKKARLHPPTSSKQVNSSSDQKLASDQKPAFDQKEHLLDKCRRVQIPWRAPPEIQITSQVSTGEISKELEIQRNRIHREKETVYQTLQDIPSNPREPWDIEMDYDDSLTPEIPIEQLPEVDEDASVDCPVPEPEPSTSTQAEPDLELLAVLLKNPELVFALTSGQASGLSSEDTVKLLDMLKSSGGAGLLNGQTFAKPEQARIEVSLPSPTPITRNNVEVSLPSPTPPSRFEVSLPSPTPSTNPGPSGWTATQPAKNPFSRHTIGVQDSMTSVPVVTTAVITSDRSQTSGSLRPQPSLPPHLSSQPHFSVPPPSIIHESHPAYLPPTVNHNLATVNSSVPSYSQPIPSLSRSQMHLYSREYVPEPRVTEDSDMGMLNARHGSSYNVPFSSNFVDQHVYNQTMKIGQPGPTRGNGHYRGGHKGYESWSPENSPGPISYPSEHHHAHGRGWNREDAERGYGHPDRVSRHQNWHGVGGVNRRWNNGERRR